MAALAWERERAAADASALRVAEAERFLRASSGQLPVDTEPGPSSSRQAPPAGSGARYDPTDPMVAQLHLQAVGVQNIRALVSVLLDPASSSYGRWRDQVLLALRRYALDDHVLVDLPIEARDVAWLRLDSVALSWIFRTSSGHTAAPRGRPGWRSRGSSSATPITAPSSSTPPSAPSCRGTSPSVSTAGG